MSNHEETDSKKREALTPVEDLKKRIEQMKERARQEGCSERSAEFLSAYFDEDDHYDARWPLRAILEDDDALALREALSAGLPWRAPIGFHGGTTLLEACLIGAPQCVSELLAWGADPNEGSDELPIEMLAEQVGERGEPFISIARELVANGAWVTHEERSAGKERTKAALGARALSMLSMDWDQVVGWARRQTQSDQEVIERVAQHLNEFQKACGLDDELHYGAPVSQELMRRAALPEALGTALLKWRAQEQAEELDQTSQRGKIPKNEGGSRL